MRIALLLGKTGPLEAYAKDTETGFMMGLEYLTGGKMELDGRKLKVIVKDDQVQARPRQGRAGRGLWRRQGRDRRGHDLVGRDARDAAGGARSTRRS